MVELVDPRSKAYVALRVYRNPDQGQGARLELSRGGDGLVADDIPFAPAIQPERPCVDHQVLLGELGWRDPPRAPPARRHGAALGARSRGRLRGARDDELGHARRPRPRVSGHVRVGSQTIDLGGWRGSLEHRWGTFSRNWHAWDHAGTALVHTRGGSAWMLLGVNRRDLLTGAGARDAFWLGLLVRATPRGTELLPAADHAQTLAREHRRPGRGGELQRLMRAPPGPLRPDRGHGAAGQFLRRAGRRVAGAGPPGWRGLDSLRRPPDSLERG